MCVLISTDAVAAATVRLRAAGCVFAEDETAVLVAAAADEAALRTLVGRRAAGEPLEQVVGHADFCGVRVRLRPGVFVPRVRSELLVRLAVPAARDAGDRPVVVDLCCGSGALGLALRRQMPTAEVHAADVDPVAVACARDNFSTRNDHGTRDSHKARTNLVARDNPDARDDLDARDDSGDHVHLGDLFEALPAELHGRIDVLIANVPYVATRHLPLLPAEARLHEPRTALDGGGDGLDVFRAVLTQAPAWLAPGGVLLSEITAAQRDTATAAVRAAGLEATVTEDEDLDARVVRGRRALR